MTNPAQASNSNNNNQDSKANKKVSTINTTAKAFFGEIRQFNGQDSNEPAYYVDCNLLAGQDSGGKARYQRMSLRVNKKLASAFAAAYQSQVKGQDNSVTNALSNTMMEVKIYGSFFKPWKTESAHGVNGEGVLMSFEPTQQAS